jgi:predicted DNA binding CopG/RHH family protein
MNGGNMKRASKRTPRDLQVEEFEKRDLGDDIARSGSGVVIDFRGRQRPTSIFLDPALIEKLKQKGSKRGIGYQTMLKIIVHEHVDDY